jgi:rhamnosyltransferase
LLREKGPIKISVIIPTLNAGPSFEKLLSSLQEQSAKPAEIIVIDSGSTDATCSTAQKYQARLILVEPGSFDHGATRNLAAEQASGDILVYMTQDALPAGSGTLQELIKPLQAEKTVLSYARQLAPIGAPLSDQFLRLANYPPRSALKSLAQVDELGIKTFQSSNVCAAYRRKEFEALGRFPAPVVCNEDMLFASKALYSGYQVAYTAEAQVWHSHSLGPVAKFKRYFDIAASLEHDPRLLQTGQAGKHGAAFMKEQLHYVWVRKKYQQLPLVIVESGAKYLGFKAGEHHSAIPRKLKKYLGLNSAYWRNLESNSPGT